MKYMGSKRTMLLNGLGEALNSAAVDAERIVDLFTGSGAVATFAAEAYERPVVASDLQQYACALAASVITRTRKVNVDDWWDDWLRRALGSLRRTKLWRSAQAIQDRLGAAPISELAGQARSLSAEAPEGSLMRAYGGYYFSPLQALTLDALRAGLPTAQARQTVLLGALIQTASKCAAAPGHTAQPFKPSESAGRYLAEAWSRDVISLAREAAISLGGRAAHVKGEVVCGDALEVAKALRPGDLAFVDPPYSSVHYSRFYHVLEAVARGSVSSVAGSGRYPPQSERPRSEFSVQTEASAALHALFRVIAESGASAVVTFPAGEASNGLSGEAVSEIAREHFAIDQSKVSSRFSTLGGNKKHRAARHDADELILTLRPR